MGLPTLPKIYNVYFVAIVATLGGMLYVLETPSPPQKEDLGEGMPRH